MDSCTEASEDVLADFVNAVNLRRVDASLLSVVDLDWEDLTIYTKRAMPIVIRKEINSLTQIVGTRTVHWDTVMVSFVTSSIVVSFGSTRYERVVVRGPVNVLNHVIYRIFVTRTTKRSTTMNITDILVTIQELVKKEPEQPPN